MYSRSEFEQLRAELKRRERRDGLLLASVAVGMGLGQLGLIRWLESRFSRGTAVPIEAGVFVLYIVLVLLAIHRLQRHRRGTAPRCPQCDRPLTEDSLRIAAATGKCDNCGGQVLAP